MQFKKMLAVVFGYMVSGLGVAMAQGAVDPLQALVETSAHRLAIGEQVALSKWDSGKAVEDAPREAQVVEGAVKISQSKGLDEASVTNFFKAQIEANKIIQYSLLADWRRAGKAPAHGAVDLVGAIRPQLDTVQTELIHELTDTATVRAGATCRVDVAKAVGRYLSTHKQKDGGLYEIALDRALAATCAP